MLNQQVSTKPFKILQNSRRMMVIKVLLQLGGTACLREVVRRIATLESGDAPNRSQRKSVYTSLVQNHLPKMKLAGLIEYDRETDALHLMDLPRSYRYHLEAVEKGDLPWCLYYLTLSAVGIFSGLLLAAYTGFWAGSLLTVILSFLVFVSAVFHTARTYGVNGIELLPMGMRAITKRINSHRKNVKIKEE
jgi:hypothetical protein